MGDVRPCLPSLEGDNEQEAGIIIWCLQRQPRPRDVAGLKVSNHRAVYWELLNRGARGGLAFGDERRR